MKCWIAGHPDGGYLLFWTETRGKARAACAGTFGMDFDEALYLDVRRVPTLDEFPEHLSETSDERLFLLAGGFTECRCGVEVSLNLRSDWEGYQEPWFTPKHVLTGPWCAKCKPYEAHQMSRNELLDWCRESYGLVATR